MPTVEDARSLLPAMVDAVGALVSVESPSEDLAACEAVVTEAVGALSAWLPSPARVERHGGRPVWRWGPDHPRILLLGHLDTVWPLGSLDRLPFTADDERMSGPGVFDMKAGVVQGWAALALAGCSDDGDVGMLLTTDEEIGSSTSRTLIVDAARAAQAVLVLEPAVDGALKSARKGTSWYQARLDGRAVHAGLDPERGINALTAAAELVLACTSWAETDVGTTVVPTMLQAGTAANTVPAHADLSIDVRAWTRAEQERVDSLVRTWRPVIAPSAQVRIGGGINRPALEPVAAAALLDLARATAEDLGLGRLDDRAVGGASDGNFTAAAGIPTLDGLGAVGDGAHADDEWASVPAMAERSALLAGLLLRL